MPSLAIGAAWREASIVQDSVHELDGYRIGSERAGAPRRTHGFGEVHERRVPHQAMSVSTPVSQQVRRSHSTRNEFDARTCAQAAASAGSAHPCANRGVHTCPSGRRPAAWLGRCRAPEAGGPFAVKQPVPGRRGRWAALMVRSAILGRPSRFDECTRQPAIAANALADRPATLPKNGTPERPPYPQPPVSPTRLTPHGVAASPAPRHLTLDHHRFAASDPAPATAH